MNEARLYATWNLSDYDFHGKVVKADPVPDDPFPDRYSDIPDPYFSPVSDLEEYLETYGTKIRENEYFKGNEGNIWTVHSDTYTSIYKIENATIFVRHVQHTDDWPSECPDRQTIAIRIYSSDNVDKLVQDIVGLVPNISINRERSMSVYEFIKKIFC